MAKIDEVSEGDIPTQLQAILKKVELARRNVEKGIPCPGIQPNEVRSIVCAFLGHDHMFSYLVLSTVVSFLREECKKDNVPDAKVTERISRLFYAEMDNGMRATDVIGVQRAMALNESLLQIDAQVGAHLFLRDGMREWLQEIPELFPSSDTLVWRHVAILLSLASGVASCRPVLKQFFQSWLQQQSRISSDLLTRSSSAVGLTKLTRAVGDHATPEEGMWNTGVPSGQDMDEEKRQKIAQDAELTSLMKGLVISGSEEEDASPATDAVEGLAYLSAERTLKESLSSDAVFLEHLFSLIPTTRKHNNLIARQIDDAPTAKTTTAITYGIAVVISNLVTYPPRLTEEEAQYDKLKRMAQPGAASPSGRLQDPDTSGEQKETDEIVAARGKRLIKAGVLPVLAALVRAESAPTRIAVGQSYLALVEPKENRGEVLQNGGAKALSFLSRAGSLFLPPGSDPFPLFTNDRAIDFQRRGKGDLIPIQALAKLAITTRPQLMFGTADSDITDAIQPFHMLVLHPDSSLLQRFEALMALTNLASVSPVAANRVATAELASKLEVLMLDDNEMVRRASAELACNIITTDAMLPRYGGVPASEEVDEKELVKSPPAPAIISRVHILLGLSDVEDIKTQLAASGALATLLPVSPASCKALLSIKKGPSGVFAILGDIVDPSRIGGEAPPPSNDPGELLQLAHRGVVCIWSILSHASALDMETEVLKAADEEKIAAALVTLIKPLMASEARNSPGPRQIIITSAQALQWLNERGIEVRA